MEMLSFWLIWGVLGAVMLIYYMRCAHKIRSVLWGTVSGLAGLVLMHYFGGGIGFSPEFNLFNIMQSAILGIPGVVLMSIANLVI